MLGDRVVIVGPSGDAVTVGELANREDVRSGNHAEQLGLAFGDPRIQWES
jgi:hypothetical protein